jgi:hypothetical protein
MLPSGTPGLDGGLVASVGEGFRQIPLKSLKWALVELYNCAVLR